MGELRGNSKQVSVLERRFHLSEKGTDVKTEILAGFTTFLACVSIVALNPMILSAAGMDMKAVFWATALSAAFACIWMGLWGNFPFALGPAMGLNSYMAYYVVKTLGLSWENALACVCISGCCFMLLSVFRVQQKIVDAIPACIKQTVGAGVGFFIAFIGFQEAGIVVASPDTLLTLGNLGNPGTLLALLGIVVMSVLIIRNVKGGILIGIFAVTILGLFVKNPETMASYTKMPAGLIAFDNPVTALSPTFGKLTVQGMFNGPREVVLGVIFAIVSFLFVDLFDSIGVLLGVAPKAGMVDADGKVPGAGKALFVSAGSAALGAVLGTSTVSIYGAESTTGIAEGGRTGLTACVTGLLFLLTLLFSPIFLMIPSVATAPALIMVGIFMMEPLCRLDLGDFKVAMPVFFAVTLMPFTYNIAYGIMFSMISYTVGQIAGKEAKKIPLAVWLLTLAFVGYLMFGVLF